MVKVKKSFAWMSTHAAVEEHEEFDRKKILMALVRAGMRDASEVRQIAALVEPCDGMTTDDIDRVVVSELEKRDPVTAKYWKVKRDYNRARFRK